MWFVVLTALITVIVVIAGWEVITKNVGQYLASFLILSGIMVGVFSAADGMLFYVFFEATLIPMYIIIGVWGGAKSRVRGVQVLPVHADGLAPDAGRVALSGTSRPARSISPTWQHAQIAMTPPVLLFIAFFMAFAVKVPMWPVHTWLPDAHVEAPTGRLRRAGRRSCLSSAHTVSCASPVPIAPDASHFLAPVVITLALIAVIYIGLVRMVQADMKKLVACPSMRALGFVTLGFFIFNAARRGRRDRADDLPHGFLSGASVFLSIGVLYDRVHSRQIADYARRRQRDAEIRGVRDAVLDGQLRLAGLATGFVGEFMVILAACPVQLLDRGRRRRDADSRRGLTLWMCQAHLLGAVANDHVKGLFDINRR